MGGNILTWTGNSEIKIKDQISQYNQPIRGDNIKRYLTLYTKSNQSSSIYCLKYYIDITLVRVLYKLQGKP